MNRWFLLAAMLLINSAEAGDSKSPPENPVLHCLLREGVELAGHGRETLPSPTLRDGLDAAQQRAVVRRAAGRHGWDRFVRDSAVAPFQLDIGSLEDSQGNRIGYTVDLSFVAHGALETLFDEQFLRQLSPSGDQQDNQLAEKARELNDATLAQFGIDRQDGERLQKKFVYGGIPLLERVHVYGVVHAASSRTEESLRVAWKLDRRFAESEAFSARWRPIETDELGRKSLGAARPYEGYGGYCKVTRLAEPAGALFIECQMVVHEPEGWFAGSNLLRAKMPLLVQENVRKFRRQLAKAE